MDITSPFAPQRVYSAILQHLAEHPSGEQRRAIHEAVAQLLDLSESQRNERIGPNKKVLRYRHRSGWALSALKAAGYVDNPAESIWRITERGRELLKTHPNGLDEKTARAIIRETHREEVLIPNNAQETPEERIDAAITEIRRMVAEELIEKISQAPPAFFEALVLDLLHALGYGAQKEDLERVGGTGDGGIDGVISLDKLGFEKVYVQAKRWQGAIGRPEVQAFFGALSGRRARKGVFITTSSFTREALEFGRQVAESIVLIDGARLTALMIDYGVGVSHYQILRLPRVDRDYFDAE